MSQRVKENYVCTNPIHKGNNPTWEGDKKDNIKEVRCSKRLKFDDEKFFGCGEKGFVQIEFLEKQSIHEVEGLNLDDILSSASAEEVKRKAKTKTVPINENIKSKPQGMGALVSISMIDILHKGFFGFLKIDLNEIPDDMRDNLNQSAMDWIDTLDFEGTPQTRYLSNLIIVGIYGSIRRFNINRKEKQKAKQSERVDE